MSPFETFLLWSPALWIVIPFTIYYGIDFYRKVFRKE